MATVDIENAPDPTTAFTSEPVAKESRTLSSLSTEDGGISRRRLKLVIVVVLGISLLFQTIALVAPGWSIIHYEEDEILQDFSSSSGLFYFVACVDEDQDGSKTCKAQSYLNSFTEEYQDASDAAKGRLKRKYNLETARKQVGAIISWIFTLLSIFILVFTMIKTKPMLHIGFFLGCILSVTGIIMGEIIYVALVEITYLKSLPSKAKVGFPYCVFFYILSCLEIFASCVLVFKCFHDDVIVLKRRLSEQEVLLDREKKHVEYLRSQKYRRSPRSSRRDSPLSKERNSRNLRPSPRGSPRVSREINPSPRVSPRPSPRPPRDQQEFFPPSPRNSFELRDYDRHSPRPPRDRNGERPRNHDRPNDIPDRSGDKHRDVPRDYDRPKDHNRPRGHRDYRPREHGDDRLRSDKLLHVPGPMKMDPQPTEPEDDNYRFPTARSQDYQPVPVSSDSETPSENAPKDIHIPQGNDSDMNTVNSA